MTVSYVSAQSCKDNFGAGPFSSCTVTGSAVSNGNTICVFAAGISNESGGEPFNWTITDNASNTYSGEGKTVDANGMGYIWYYCASSSGSPTQFTLNGGGDSIQYASIIVDVFSGVSASSLGVGNNSQFNPGAGTDAITCTPETSISNGALVWCVCLVDFNNAPSVVAGTGFTAGQSATGNYPYLYSEYKIGSGYTSPAATFTDATEGASGNNYYSTGSLEFLATSSGTTFTFGPQDWDWQGNAPTVSMSFLFANKAWHWAANAPTISSAFTFANKAWHWVDNGFSLTFTTSLAFQKAWAWTARRAIFSGGNFPSVKGWNVIRPVIWGALRGIFVRPLIGPDQ